MNDIANTLLETIDYATDQKLQIAEFDKTIICTVLSISNDIVTVTNSGTIYTVKVKNNNSIKVFDKVHLKFPSNNQQNKYLEEDLLSVGNGQGSSSGGTGDVIISGVSSVNGKTDAVIINIDDIPNLRASLNSLQKNQITMAKTDPDINFVGGIWYEIVNEIK